MDLYVLIKYIHVVAAIAAVGFNLSYGVWLVRSRRPEDRLHVLRGVKFLDDYIANPAYVLLLLTGLAMVAVGSLSLTTTWIAIALGLYVVLVILGLGVFSRALAGQIRMLDAGTAGIGDAAYEAIVRRTTWSGALLVLIALVIVFLMVTKPTL